MKTILLIFSIILLTSCKSDRPCSAYSYNTNQMQMSVEEIKLHYANEIEKASTDMEKNMLKAERNHKLKLLKNGQESDYSKMAQDSNFECLNCGS